MPGSRKWRWLAWSAAALVGLGIVVALVLWLTLPDVSGLAHQNPTTTAFIELRRQEAAQAGRKFSLKWTWRPLKGISPLLQRAVLHTEDAHFFEHQGVDWEAVRETAERDWKEKSMSSGGSTITQQLAKNLYLSPQRSLVRKMRELFITWRLEAALEKDRILELYLNIAEWGPGIFGAEAASRHWYGCSAYELTADQAARLAVALPNPIARSPKVHSRVLDRKAARVVRALHRGGLINETQLAEALRALGQAPTVVAPPPTEAEAEAEPPPEAPTEAPEPTPPPPPPDAAPTEAP
jgi:monofunctional biosynthetic peptidoglycan transglycosylase